MRARNWSFVKKTVAVFAICAVMGSGTVFAGANTWGGSTTTLNVGHRSGNVGIGTANPAARLHVVDTLNTTGQKIVFRGTTNNANAYAAIQLGNNSGSPRTVLGYKTGDIAVNENGQVGIGTTVPGSVLQVNGGAAIGYSTSTSAPANGLVVYGQVGIGTTAVGTFKLAVEGKVGAREVVVTQTTPWPDFVFKNDYKLKPLEQVEKQIKEHKHLENIPTEVEVRKNGVSVGEMQAKLLQKVEELTLYMIELQKDNQQLKRQMNELKRQIGK